jgi:caffeoyl-CoA O-methyltransferase
MDFLEQDILNYCNQLSSSDKLLDDLERETNYKVLMPRMISGKIMGNFLKLISNLKKPKHILEIGTYTGYSAICLAEGITQDGQLHTIEINEELKLFSSKYFKKANLENKITLHIGNAIDVIPTIDLLFDIVFIDADKKNYCKYYELAIQKSQTGGYILIDNVLWSGKVLDEAKVHDIETQEIQKLNNLIINDNRVENTLIPIRDGLMICKVL